MARSIFLSAFVVLFLGLALGGCDDPEPFYGVEDTRELCSDGVDNDQDQMTDCFDIDCRGFCSGDADADTDADVDADADTDTDADTDADGDSDTDSEGEDADVDGEVDEDVLELPVACDATTECPEDSQLCYDFLLDGNRVCAPRGPSCATGADCPDGVTCGPPPLWPTADSYCLVSSATCTSNRGCPDGFRCEEGACVDRRFVCENNEGCPPWSRCESLRSRLRVCTPWSPEPCQVEDQCGGGACVDVDGDGDTECQVNIESSCETNADCADGVCGNSDGAFGVECGAVGPCLVSTDCLSGMGCVDVNSDGDLECQSTSGTCSLDSDCPPKQLCFGATPQCQGS